MVFELAIRQGTCALCGHAIVSTDGLVLDHKLPYSEGGRGDAGNLRAVHWICNASRLVPPEHPGSKRGPSAAQWRMARQAAAELMGAAASAHELWSEPRPHRRAR